VVTDWRIAGVGDFNGDGKGDLVWQNTATGQRSIWFLDRTSVLVETMTALDELALAVTAARDAGAPFVIASLAFDATRVGPRTMMGVSPEAAAAAALELGVDALGANCGALELEGYADVLRRFRSVAPGLPLLCRPNAGTPRLEHGTVTYHLTPERMAQDAALLVDAGAAIIGGCCGTTPAHIAALRTTLGI
jgi:5-methyltetrahydrofolate--homocysteine methyltransferase